MPGECLNLKAVEEGGKGSGRRWKSFSSKI